MNRLQPLPPPPQVPTVLKEADRSRLASLGLPDDAIAEIEELVVQTRDDMGKISTPATWRAGMDKVRKPVRPPDARVRMSNNTRMRRARKILRLRHGRTQPDDLQDLATKIAAEHQA